MLYIVATPIGNIEDITLRALRVLKEADVVLAEDTRKTGIFLKRLQIDKPLMSFYEHNEVQRLPSVLEELKKGKTVVLVSSAGTPTISDPGYKLVRQCRAEGLPVTSVPGPSSVMNALALTSLEHEAFAFLGYLPKKSGARKRELARIKAWNITAVFFESPFRVVKTLADIREICPERRVALLREMTKKFEELFEGTPDEAFEHFSRLAPRGEFVVVVSGRP